MNRMEESVSSAQLTTSEGRTSTKPRTTPTNSYSSLLTTTNNPTTSTMTSSRTSQDLLQDQHCVNASDPEDLVAVFTDFYSKIRYFEGKTYVVKCCEGISVDLLNSISRDLHFSYEMHLVGDGLFGLPRQSEKWDGITGDLISGAAHMAFSAFSITSARVKVIDFSVPFFYSGVSCLAQQRSSNVPIAAFLLPFSIQLWVAIFSSIILTAIAAATYEWLSPFGLNPWGRQRTKFFSIGSSFWVIFSILFSISMHLKPLKVGPAKY